MLEVIHKNDVELYEMLEVHRFNWVVDFMHNTAISLLAEIEHDRFTRYDLRVLYRYAKKDFPVNLLKLPATTHNWRRYTAGMLQDLFRACRKLCLADQETVSYNFNLTRLRNDTQ